MVFGNKEKNTGGLRGGSNFWSIGASWSLNETVYIVTKKEISVWVFLVKRF